MYSSKYNQNFQFIYIFKTFHISSCNVLGHMQQGDRPSPFDRSLGTKFASKAIDWLDEQINANIRSDCKLHIVCLSFYIHMITNVILIPPAIHILYFSCG